MVRIFFALSGAFSGRKVVEPAPDSWQTASPQTVLWHFAKKLRRLV
jgi:hypothetical protein